MNIRNGLKLSAIVILFAGVLTTTSAFAGDDDAGEVKGTIQSLPSGSLVGDWRVGGRTVHVTSTSQLKNEHGAFAVGVRVKVKGVGRSDGSVDARKIQVRDSF